MTGKSASMTAPRRSPKVGLFLPTGEIMLGGATAGWSQLLELARRAEDLGFDSLWFPDHVLLGRGDGSDAIGAWECWSLLSALAAATRRVELGSLVICTGFRNPALLAKMCAMLDVISHGRSIVGLGAAWHEAEFVAYGWSFPPLRERMQMLEEAVQIVDRMLTTRPATFHGKHFQVVEAFNDPMPVQQPRPPIMIGGDGERVTLRLVAQIADFCNVFGDPATVAHKFDVLRGHCKEVGRDDQEITRSNHVSILIARDEDELERKRERFGARLPDFEGLVGTPPTIIAGLRKYAASGSQYVTFSMPDAEEVEPVRLFGETVIPALVDL